MSKYLDSNGLLYFWQKLKTALGTKVDAVAGKGLSTNDYTTAEKTKLEGISAGANAYTHPSYTSKTSALYKVTVDGQGHVSAATAAAKADITALGVPGQDTTYSEATGSVAGLMAAADKTKLDGIAAGANNYTHPSATAKASGLYKVTVDALGHVTAAAAAAKADITALGIPGQDTTYANATGSVAGLMAAADKAKLDGFGAASTYALKSDVTSMYRHKGSVAAVGSLPDTGNTAGDVYNVTASGMNYVWTGSEWDALGGVFSLESITNAEIDTVVAS